MTLRLIKRHTRTSLLSRITRVTVKIWRPWGWDHQGAPNWLSSYRLSKALIDSLFLVAFHDLAYLKVIRPISSVSLNLHLVAKPAGIIYRLLQMFRTEHVQNEILFRHLNMLSIFLLTSMISAYFDSFISSCIVFLRALRSGLCLLTALNCSLSKKLCLNSV